MRSESGRMLWHAPSVSIRDASTMSASALSMLVAFAAFGANRVISFMGPVKLDFRCSGFMK